MGVLSGRVVRFKGDLLDSGRPIKVPHMGWSQVYQEQEHPLWSGIPQHTRFYFVHSYYAETKVQAEIAATTQYGLKFVCAAASENLFAVQFHPEKSRRQGLQLLENFIQWNGEV